MSEEGKFAGKFVQAENKRKREKNVTMQPFSSKNCLELVWEAKRKVIPGNNNIMTIAMHIQEPLIIAACNQRVVLRERKSFKTFVRSYFLKSPSVKH